MYHPENASSSTFQITTSDYQILQPTLKSVWKLNAQNFYLLKIFLNLFEILNRVLKLESLMEIVFPSDFFLKHGSVEW
jgi:hypothetical protein